MKIINSTSVPVPASVYRLQLNSHFPFSQAIKILPYLKELGVEGVYCSPYFKAYSDHGYDVTDPNALNPLIGTLEEYQQFCAELKRLNLMHIIDIVPNHMGIKGGQNIWWQDVLENGPYSEFASFFDINWNPEKKELKDRVLFPILGEPYGKALENQEIKLEYGDGTFTLHYADYPLPVASHTYALILENDLDQLKKSYKEEEPEWVEFQELITLCRFFPGAPEKRSIRKKEVEKKLNAFFINSPRLRKHILRQVHLFNGKKRKASSFDLLDKLLEGQFYRLAYWRVARHEINYRLFFNVPELVSIRIEEEKIFEEHHRWLFELIREGHIQGLRIDHPDGLYNPTQYFQRLRRKFLLFTVVEKILGRKEKLSENWEVEGTVGYEYLNLLNGLFVKRENAKAFLEIYEDFIGKSADFATILYESKKFFTNYHMLSEIEAFGLMIDTLSEANRNYRDFTRHELTRALAEVIAFFPVYRTYIDSEGVASQHDCHYIKIAVEKAKNKVKNIDVLIFDFLEKVLTDKIKEKPEIFEGYKEFALRFQQLTAPVMAKGLEDTAFYIYNRFIALNEVGGDPLHFGYSIGDFHSLNQEKKERWPFGFLATSTHDTKRSEDVRTRLDVLSEIPEIWKAEVRKWAFVNSKHKKQEVSANTEYYIYQTLLGVWPSKPFQKEEYTPFCERIWQVILKSIREAKLETNWVFPNVAYEEAVHAFLFAILLKDRKNHFLKMFLDFHRLINRCGAWNTLSQSILKMGSPGVVDIYQGNETLTYRLIDPDNRSPVDFGSHKKMLRSLQNAKIDQLFASHDLAKVKLFLQTRALHYRLENKDLFLEGDYIPLRTEGARKDHLIAFMRKQGGKTLIVLAGRFFSDLAPNEGVLPLGKYVWGDTEVILPANLEKKTLTDLFTHKKHPVKTKGDNCFLSLSKVFESLPVSYLIL